MDDVNRLLAWDMYYASMVSIRFHPPVSWDDVNVALEVMRCAEVADYMMEERSKRCVSLLEL